MVQEVYVDLYFLINVSMDLLCLLITASLLHCPVRRWRAVTAALLGGGYAVLSLLLSLGGAISLLLDLCGALLLCLVAFHSAGQGFWRSVRASLVFALCSMTLGGVMTALYSLLNRWNLPLDALQGDGLSVWTFALLSAVASIATLRGGRLSALSQKTKRITLSLSLFGKELTLSAMVDSGNLLRDPVSGKSVIVADLSRLSPILPAELARAYQSGDFSEWMQDYTRAKKLRPIPTQSAMGKGILFAIVPDRLLLHPEGKKPFPADYLIAPAPLGESAQGFDAVIAPD